MLRLFSKFLLQVIFCLLYFEILLASARVTTNPLCDNPQEKCSYHGTCHVGTGIGEYCVCDYYHKGTTCAELDWVFVGITALGVTGTVIVIIALVAVAISRIAKAGQTDTRRPAVPRKGLTESSSLLTA
jgi:hypothetical protein